MYHAWVNAAACIVLCEAFSISYTNLLNRMTVKCNQEKIEPDEMEFLMLDYKKIMLATSSFNDFVGKWMGGIVLTLYVQFVSDVFIMVQLLKQTGIDFLAVSFFCQDAIAGMFLIFKMLILMSRLYPASKHFLWTCRDYFTNDRLKGTMSRKYMLKYHRNLRVVGVKLGGHLVTPTAVPHGIQLLFSYYIAAGNN